MADKPSFLKSILKKGVIGIVIGVVLVGATKALHFPPVFQMMFFAYAMLGTIVFILLDAPSMNRVEGVKAIVALVAFYLVLSVVYIGGASLWPQYDPEVEKGKIKQILNERRQALYKQAEPGLLLKRNKELSEKAQALMARLKALGIEKTDIAKDAGGTGAPAAGAGSASAGEDQWNLQECFNCHVITKGMKSKKKKRGPNLDNIGNLMTPEQMKEKILDPKSWMAEGYEKQYEKGKMPDKYKDLMFDDEVDALVSFLATLKDTSANTPKAIKKK